MNRNGRDWITLSLAAAGVIGAISLAGIFIVYLADSIGGGNETKTVTTARSGGFGLGSTLGSGATGGNAGAGSAGGRSSSGSGKAGATGASGKAGAAGQGPKIPDDQRYKTFKNRSAGYSVLVPRGWKKHVRGKLVGFSKGADFMLITAANGPPPTIKFVTKNIAKNNNLQILEDPRHETVGGNAAIVAKVQNIKRTPPFYVEQFHFGQNKKVAAVNLGTPASVFNDNEDDFRRIASSFRWL
jgi:hypothetical protein